jgi:hypothetical protein
MVQGRHYSTIPGAQLFFKILHKGPIVHLLQHLEGHLAIGTENQVAGRFIPIQWNISITDRTCQIFYHEIPPQIIAVDFLFMMIAKIQIFFFPLLGSSFIIEHQEYF